MSFAYLLIVPCMLSCLIGTQAVWLQIPQEVMHLLSISRGPLGSQKSPMGLRLWGPLFCPELPVFVLCTSTPLASYLCHLGGFLLGGRRVARGITPHSPTPWLSTPSLVLTQCQVCLRVSPDHKCTFPERSPPGPAGQGPC